MTRNAVFDNNNAFSSAFKVVAFASGSRFVEGGYCYYYGGMDKSRKGC